MRDIETLCKDQRRCFCWCGRFEVALCCGRYLEDAQGHLVHTAMICYDTTSGTPKPLKLERDNGWF